MKINNEILTYLRQNTRLKREDKNLLNNLENSIEELIYEFNKMEHSDFGVYSTRLIKAEYEIRRNILERNLIKKYLASGTSNSLSEYTDSYILNAIEIGKQNKGKNKVLFRKRNNTLKRY